jgi:hypothetical protein
MALPTTIEFILAIVAAILIAYAFLIEPYRIRVTRLQIEIPNLPGALNGFTICHLSDLHTIKYGYIERRLNALLRGLKVDLGVITGDLADGYGKPECVADALRGFTPKLGIYAVSGNGEWGLRIPFAKLRKDLSDSGIVFLCNEHVSPFGEDGILHIIGVDDPFSQRDDPKCALQGVGDQGIRIMLAHSPDIFQHLDDVVDLVLVGHTHGGQIRMPLIGPLWLHCRYHLGIANGYQTPEELSRRTGRSISRMRGYVSRGLGNSGIHARFLCPPEVAILTLHEKVSSDVG